MENVNGQIKKKSGGLDDNTAQISDNPYESERKMIEGCISLYERAVN